MPCRTDGTRSLRGVLRPLLLALLLLAAVAPPAVAAPVLVVGGGTARLRDDPALPPDAMAVPPPGGVRSCAAQTPPRAAAAAGPTVARVLARAESAGQITRRQHDDWLATYRHARGVAARMRSSRGGELRAVVAGADALARRRALTP